MLVEELRGILVHRGSLIMNGRRMLMRPDMPALMLLVLSLPVSFAHNPSLSREALGHKTCQQQQRLVF